MSLTEMCILMAMGYLCIHSFVSRICKCVEVCYTAKYRKGETEKMQTSTSPVGKNHQPVPGRDEVK